MIVIHFLCWCLTGNFLENWNFRKNTINWNSNGFIAKIVFTKETNVMYSWQRKQRILCIPEAIFMIYVFPHSKHLNSTKQSVMISSCTLVYKELCIDWLSTFNCSKIKLASLIRQYEFFVIIWQCQKMQSHYVYFLQYITAKMRSYKQSKTEQNSDVTHRISVTEM